MRIVETLPLRLGALAAAVMVIQLRELIDPRAVFLTLLFYLTPYLFIALSPERWRGFQVGFAVGFCLSMPVAIVGTLIGQLGFPGPEPTPDVPVVIRSSLLYLNLALVVIAIGTWIWGRKRISHPAAAMMVLPGIAYPFAAFLIEIVIGGTLYH